MRNILTCHNGIHKYLRYVSPMKKEIQLKMLNHSFFNPFLKEDSIINVICKGTKAEEI